MLRTIRTTKKRTLHTFSSLAVLTLLVGGCGSDDRDDSGDDHLAVLNPLPVDPNDPNNNDPNDPNNNDPNDPNNNNDPNNDSDPNNDNDDDDTSSTPSDFIDLASDLPKFDIGSPKVAPNVVAVADHDFSYIWIANSPQGTVSKLDTKTVEEVGRYLVHSDGEQGYRSPSRTSVNLSGDAAVANRAGGVTKMWAVEERCEDGNGDGEIQTSDGPNFLDWGEEECIAWHTPMDYGSQRAIAWTKGDAVQVGGNTAYANQKLWVTGIPANGGSIDVLYMNGDTGDVEETITIPGSELSGITEWDWASYGGAVDGGDNFWFHGGNGGSGKQLVRVDVNDFDYQIYQKPSGVQGYGMTVDPNGRVWICGGGANRFDPETEEWEEAVNAEGFGSGSFNVNSGGCMVDGEGRLWVGGTGNELYGIDIDDLKEVKNHPLPVFAKGISIDFEGFVWGVESAGSNAYKVDPETGDYDVYSGLYQAYTYSDMTGFALQTAGVLDPVK